MLPTIESVSEVVPFFIVKRAVVPFFVVKWPQNQIIFATLKGSHCPESHWKLVPDILDKYTLYKAYDAIAMLGDGPDLIWHSLQLLDRYDAFCLQYLGFKVTHLPCSLYPLYGVELPTSSCVGKCVPSTCKGDGGGCKPDEGSLRRDTDPAEVTRERILAGRYAFVTSYTFVFGTPPDLAIWNVLDR